MRLLSEYRMDCRELARTSAGSLWRVRASGLSPRPFIELNTEPSPTAFQSTRCGSGCQGAWLETRTISAISGPRPGLAYSARWKYDRAYWSGIVAQLKCGPW